MDCNNTRRGQGQGQAQIPVGQVMGRESAAARGMDTGDWRNRLQADSRQRLVNKILETLKKHLPLPGREGMLELEKIAVRFEERIYTTAISQVLFITYLFRVCFIVSYLLNYVTYSVQRSSGSLWY